MPSSLRTLSDALRARGRRDWALFIARADGTQARRLSVRSPLEPRIRRSSLLAGRATRCLRRSRVLFEQTLPDYGIYVISTDGSGLREVASGIERRGPRRLLLGFLGRIRRHQQPPRSLRREPCQRDDMGSWAWSPARLCTSRPPSCIHVAPGPAGFVLGAFRRHDTPLRTRPGRERNHWSPDAKRIAFQLGFQGKLAVVDANGRGLRILPGRQSSPGAWSPDGRRIAFVSGRFGQIRVRTVDGPSAVRTLTHEDRDTDFRDIRWRAGRVSYVASLFRNDYELALLGSDGGLKILTRNNQDDLDPAWSPNRGTIVYSRDDGFEASLRLVASDGTRERLLTSRGTWRDSGPAWSPDGRQVAFVRTDRYLSGGRLVVIELATTRERTVVTG